MFERYQGHPYDGSTPQLSNFFDNVKEFSNVQEHHSGLFLLLECLLKELFNTSCHKIKFSAFEAIIQQELNNFPFIEGDWVTTQPRYSENTLVIRYECFLAQFLLRDGASQLLR